MSDAGNKKTERNLSLIAHYTDESSSEDEILLENKEDHKSELKKSDSGSSMYEKWPIKKSWVFNKKHVSSKQSA